MNGKQIVILLACISNIVMVGSDKLPIVYADRYDITFFGLEKDRPFDTQKYSKTAKKIKDAFCKNFYAPKGPISNQDLLTVHTPEYLKSLKNSYIVARIAEAYDLSWAPNWLLQWKILYPIKLATQGTVDAAELAYGNRKWAINLAGGYHHAEPDIGDGFCFFADIPIAMKKLWKKNPMLRIFYIDCDAHQGNGVEISFENLLKKGKNSDLIVFDVYSEGDYPTANLSPSEDGRKLEELFEAKGLIDPTPKIWQRAEEIQKYIQYKYPLDVTGKDRKVKDVQYEEVMDTLIKDLEAETEIARAAGKDIFIFYNAGTDPYEFDTLAWMGVTKKALQKRDEMIWRFARDNEIPIVMTLSGGYSDKTKMISSEIIGDSIINLLNKVWDIPRCEQTTLPQSAQSRSWYQSIVAWFGFGE